MHELLFNVVARLNSIVYAAGQGGQSPTTVDLKTLNPLGLTSFLDLLKVILKAAIVIATPITSLMILYGAFKILTAGAKPENLKEGKQIIFWAIMGFIIILVAGGITSVVTDFLGGCSPNPGDVNYSADCYGPPRP